MMAAIHASAFSAADAWSRDVFSLQLALPSVFGLVHRLGGFILMRVAADEAEVLTLAVAPAVRRSGLGRMLLQDACTMAATMGATVVFLEVSVRNTAAFALYTCTGFVESGRRFNYYSDNADALVLRLDMQRIED
jgi:ribosomal-protein-alanine N-acetyltransferase